MSRKSSELALTIDSLIRSRTTTRAFRSDSVPRAQLIEILDVARMAPSTFNTQPWRVQVLMGEEKNSLSKAILEAHLANSEPPHSAMPSPAPADCAARQDDFGKRYYSTLGIDRTDMVARSIQTARNFVFFDAPVGMIFTIEARLTRHSWVDYGLFLQNLMLAAHARGLATCPQVSFVRYERVIIKHLALSSQEAVVCGMSLGYADSQAELNQMKMPRDSMESFVNWRGFS